MTRMETALLVGAFLILGVVICGMLPQWWLLRIPSSGYSPLLRFWGKRTAPHTINPDKLGPAITRRRLAVVSTALNPIPDLCGYLHGCVHVEYVGRVVCLRNEDMTAMETIIHDEMVANLSKFDPNAERILGRI